MSCFTACMSMSTPDMKWVVMGMQLLPFTLCLLGGKMISPSANWKREVGIVLMVSAVNGALMAVMSKLMLANQEVQQKLPQESRDLMSDYWSGTIWIGAWSLLGVALFLLSRKPPPSEWDQRQGPRLVDR